jgi:hypothetical protein
MNYPGLQAREVNSPKIPGFSPKYKLIMNYPGLQARGVNSPKIPGFSPNYKKINYFSD